MQWLYEAFYSAIGELFADINDLGVEIFDLSWVQAVVSLFTGAHLHAPGYGDRVYGFLRVL